MRNLVALVWAWMPACIVFNPQTDYVRRTWFPSPPPPVEEASLELPTPAFQKKRGFTKHHELLAFLDAKAAAHPDVVKVTTIGTSQRGRAIPMIRLARQNAQIRVFFMGGLHGNEPAGTEGLLLLVHRLLEDPELQTLLDTIDLSIIPMANPDGFDRQHRHAANGLDLNRDQTKLEVTESIDLKQAFHEVDPAIAVDFHEYRPYRRDFLWLGTNGITSVYDVMFLYSGNLNVPESLRALTSEVFVAAVRDEMDHRGLRHHDYVVSRQVHGDIWFNQGSVQSRSSATHFALAHTVSLLIEVRGVALGRDAFERRVLTTLWTAERVLRTAAEDPNRIHRVLAETVGQPETITVVHEPAVSEGQIEAIDLAEYRTVDLDITVRDNLQSTAALSRPRPEAYALLPEGAWLGDKLEVLGLELVPLTRPVEAAVEGYTVVDVQREPFRYEGQRQQNVQIDVEASTRSLPKGTQLVRLDRPGSNIAFEVLEPEAPNSFVSFGVLRVTPGASLPFVRVTDGVDAILSPSKP